MLHAELSSTTLNTNSQLHTDSFASSAYMHDYVLDLFAVMEALELDPANRATSAVYCDCLAAMLCCAVLCCAVLVSLTHKVAGGSKAHGSQAHVGQGPQLCCPGCCKTTRRCRLGKHVKNTEFGPGHSILRLRLLAMGL